MSGVEGLRHSGLARLGLRSLMILAYLVYVAGTVLQVGLDRIVADFPLAEYLGATVVLVVGLLFVNWFFETESAGDDEAS